MVFSGKKSLILFCLTALMLFPFSSSSVAGQQQKKRIDILHTDLLESDEKVAKDLNRLIGNVQMKHNDALMWCDSAYHYRDKNQVRAFGHVRIEQGDTISLRGDYLFYDGGTEIAYVQGSVELIDKETHLYTDRINYNLSTRTAVYPSLATILNGDNTLVSKTGVYYASEKIFHFRDSVRVNNPDYVLRSDTMKYNTVSETAFFFGPTEMEGDSIFARCESGWYDTKNEKSKLRINALIDNRQQIIKGDSIDYDNITGKGKARGNVTITDTTNNAIVKGEYADYIKTPEEFLLTDKALFIQVSSGDSLFMHSDTIKVVTATDTTGRDYRIVKSWYGCRVFSEGLQAVCDSLAYSFQDSVIRMYYEPVIWSDENQLTADSIALFTRNRQMVRMEMYNNSFVVSQVDSIRYNQLKGKNLIGRFRDNKIYYLRIDGNGETIYFVLDEEALVGVNQAKSSSIEIYIEDGEITEIIQNQNPDGVMDPPGHKSPAALRLEKFSWLVHKRPADRNDLFQRK